MGWFDKLWQTRRKLQDEAEELQRKYDRAENDRIMYFVKAGETEIVGDLVLRRLRRKRKQNTPKFTQQQIDNFKKHMTAKPKETVETKMTEGDFVKLLNYEDRWRLIVDNEILAEGTYDACESAFRLFKLDLANVLDLS